jgi:hypothetical protein
VVTDLKRIFKPSRAEPPERSKIQSNQIKSNRKKGRKKGRRQYREECLLDASFSFFALFVWEETVPVDATERDGWMLLLASRRPVRAL